MCNCKYGNRCDIYAYKDPQATLGAFLVTVAALSYNDLKQETMDY